MAYTVKARYYAEPDCFGETIILQNDNVGSSLRYFEIGSKVEIKVIPVNETTIEKEQEKK